MPTSAFTHDAPSPPDQPETHTYSVVYVASRASRITVTEPDTIELALEEFNADDGEVAGEMLFADKHTARVHQLLYPQPLLASIIDSCLAKPDPTSEAYLSIIEDFNNLRVKLGTPEILTMIFHLGQLNPTK